MKMLSYPGITIFSPNPLGILYLQTGAKAHTIGFNGSVVKVEGVPSEDILRGICETCDNLANQEPQPDTTPNHVDKSFLRELFIEMLRHDLVPEELLNRLSVKGLANAIHIPLREKKEKVAKVTKKN